MRQSLTLILALCILAAIVGCEKATNESLVVTQCEAAVYQCLTEPDISVALVDCNSGKIYVELYVGDEAGAFVVNSTDIVGMLSDGCWKYVGDKPPRLGPPPSSWYIGELSDRLTMGIRINGSFQIPMHLFAELPEHDEIHITILQRTTE